MLRAGRLVLLTALAACGPGAAPFLTAVLADENESVSAAVRRSLIEVGR